jgi:hypothetical protein
MSSTATVPRKPLKWTELLWSAGVFAVLLTFSTIRLAVRNHSSAYITFGLTLVAVIVPILFLNLYRAARRAQEISSDTGTSSLTELGLDRLISSYCSTLIAAYGAIGVLVYFLK